MASYFQEGGEKASTQVKQVLAGLQNQYPQFLELMTQGLTPGAVAQLAADQAVAPGQGQMMADQLENYGSQLAEWGRKQTALDTQAAGANELALARGSGSQLADLSMQLQRKEDAPYYAMRDKIAMGYDTLLQENDPLSLSGAERAMLEKTAARSVGYGANPMNERARFDMTTEAQGQKRDRFASTLNQMSSAMKPMQSGMDMTRVATGRQTAPNQGMQFYTGAPQNSGQYMVQATDNMLGRMLDTSKQQNSQQTSAANQTGKVVGSVVQGISGGMCWVARAAYGEQDRRWRDFANWLFFDAPEWLYKAYSSAGAQFAEWVKIHPAVQRGLRFVMNKITRN